MPFFRPRVFVEARQLGQDYDEDCAIVYLSQEQQWLVMEVATFLDKRMHG